MTQQVPNALLAFDGGALSGFRNRVITLAGGTAPTESFVSFRTVTATGAAQFSETWTASAEL